MVNHKILVYNSKPGPRISYVLDFIQSFFSNLRFIECNALQTYLEWDGPSIQYGCESIKEQEFCVFNSNQLDFIGGPEQELNGQGVDINFKLFVNKETDTFDLFSACFYLLSRTEEYGLVKLDPHDRFDSSQSILTKHSALEIPIVDQWILNFGYALGSFFKIAISKKQAEVAWSVGVDIDHFYKHRHKSIFKKLGGTLLQLFKGDGAAIRERLKIYLSKAKDPYDAYGIIHSAVDHGALNYFVLAGGESTFDKNQSIQTVAIKRLISDLNKEYPVGLHPSYDAGMKPELLTREKALLEHQLGVRIVKSRFHYLRFRLPESYRLLISAGIEEDYSMGYADRIGFRAGTSHPFKWFDLEANRQTELIIYSFPVMDRVLKDHLKLNGDQALETIKSLFDLCKEHGANFHLVWHNSSFDFKGEWQGWQNTFSKAVAHFRKSEFNRLNPPD